MAELEGAKTVFDPHETERTYEFPNGEKVTLKDVCELVVRPSGTHRLKTGDGHSHIIPSGWIHIELVIKEWSA